MQEFVTQRILITIGRIQWLTIQLYWNNCFIRTYWYIEYIIKSTTSTIENKKKRKPMLWQCIEHLKLQGITWWHSKWQTSIAYRETVLIQPPSSLPHIAHMSINSIHTTSLVFFLSNSQHNGWLLQEPQATCDFSNSQNECAIHANQLTLYYVWCKFNDNYLHQNLIFDNLMWKSIIHWPYIAW